jgi:CopG family transcriptional regulator, nickel-responsive regulator
MARGTRSGRGTAGPVRHSVSRRKATEEYVVRLGVSLEPELLALLDAWVRERNSASRSDAIRALIRKELAEQELADPEADAVASVMLIYRHDAPNVLERLTAAEHRWGGHIRSSSHIHLEGGSCLQLLGIVGKRSEVVRAAEDLRGVKGIAFGRYSLGSPIVAGGSTGHAHPHPSGPEAERRGRDRD